MTRTLEKPECDTLFSHNDKFIYPRREHFAFRDGSQTNIEENQPLPDEYQNKKKIFFNNMDLV